ncbi:hypothetical protein Trydic_g20823 [Trypoxylus dichotomus]
MDYLLNICKEKAEHWQQFSSITTGNLEELDRKIQQVEKKCGEIKDTMDNIKILCKHAQAKGIVKVAPRAYITTTIKHTGEYNVEMNPEYQCTLTKEQTLEFLEEQLMEQHGILENYKVQKEQLTKRLSFNAEETNDIPDTAEMPDKIITEKGIAFKQGPFYEIMEVEENVPHVKSTKRISRICN